MENKGMDNPPYYGQQQQPYPQQQWNQPPPQYGQPGGYDQAPMHHQQGAPAPYVVAQQMTQEARPRNYSFPQGKIPTVLLFIVAFGNFLMFMILGIWLGAWLLVAFLIPIIFHGIAAISGFTGSFRLQGSAGGAIFCIIANCISLAIAIWQVIEISLALALIGDLSGKFAWLDLIHVLLEAVAVICSTALIVIPSKVACCSAAPTAPGRVIYTGATGATS